MEMVQNERLNKNQGKQVLCQCLSCEVPTWHEISVSVDVEQSHVELPVWFTQSYQIIQCRGCLERSFRIESLDSESGDYTRDDNYVVVPDEKLYPRRIKNVRDLDSKALCQLPNSIRDVYGEVLYALAGELKVLAAVGMRVLIEAICVERKTTSYKLEKKIDELLDQRVLTPLGASILHEIRAMGNDSAHSTKPHTEKQLHAALAVVQHLLVEVYVLPARRREAFPQEGCGPG
ncbi:UNVERIFIED_ORG: hypothetical protein GGR78_003594 [Xanthomonas campestris]